MEIDIYVRSGLGSKGYMPARRVSLPLGLTRNRFMRKIARFDHLSEMYKDVMYRNYLAREDEYSIFIEKAQAFKRELEALESKYAVAVSMSTLEGLLITGGGFCFKMDRTPSTNEKETNYDAERTVPTR
jgi:hypothetical protein